MLNPCFPRLYLSCLFFFLIFISKPAAQPYADTLRAQMLLQLAQQQYDSFQFQRALATAQEAESLLLPLFGENDPRMADVYCLLGNAWVNFSQFKTMQYQGRVREMLPVVPDLSKAHIYHFNAYVFLKQGMFDKALQEYQKALELYQRQPGIPHVNVGRVYNNSGYIFWLQSRFDDALEMYAKAQAVWRQVYDPDHFLVAAAHNNRGLIYLGQGRLDTALASFQMAYAVSKKWLGPDHAETAGRMNNIGLVYLEAGDLGRAESCFRAALDGFIKSGQKWGLATIYTNLGVLTNSNREADEYFRLALQLETAQGDTMNMALSLFNLATNFRAARKFDQAMEYFHKALEIAPPDHKDLGRFYNDLGVCFRDQNILDSAKFYFEKSRDICTERFGEINPQVAMTLYNLAETYQMDGDFDEALRLNQLGLRSIGYKEDDRSGVSVFQGLCGLQLQESQLLWLMAKGSRDPEQWQAVRAASLQTLNSFDQLTDTYISAHAKEQMRARAFSACEVAIAADLELARITGDDSYRQEALGFAERNKSVQLREALWNAKVRRFSDVPPDLLQQERTLLEDIARFEKILYQGRAEGMLDSDAHMAQIGKELADRRDRQAQLLEIFRKEHKLYFDAKYVSKTVGLSYLRDTLLQPNQSLLEYTVGDSSIFLFLVQKNNFEVREIKKDFPLEQLALKMTRDGIYGFYTLPEDQRTNAAFDSTATNYTSAARELYEKLLPPDIRKKLTSELIIVPDGALGYLPFEALLTGAPKSTGDFRDYPFLVYNHKISYCYSATLLREMRDKQHRWQPSGQMLAMAPFFSDNTPAQSIEYKSAMDKLALPGTGPEVTTVSQLLAGTPIYGQAASLDTFRQLAGQYRILHLSTHGQADDRNGDYAFLMFGNWDSENGFGKLYARDLYNIKLNADLVVLSACETGIGEFQRGEGIISLARAFAFAGTKSLLTSLWQVNDEKTKALMAGFYRNLQTGKTKDEALQSAKVDFLKNNPSDYGAFMHPYFWAGFIAIGDMRRL